MKKVISASRREDIVASKKSYNNLLSFAKDGKYSYFNNYTGEEEEKCIDTNEIGAICLWSKDYANFLANQGELANYNLYFNFTVDANSIRKEKRFVCLDCGKETN